MERRLICMSTVLTAFLLIFGCSTKDMHGYEPKSPDEEAIVSVFKELEKAWNNDDIEAVLSFYHDDAKIMGGGLPGRMGTIEDFKESLPALLENEEVNFLNPTSIEISDNAARVHIWNVLFISDLNRHWRLFQTWDFVKENNQWLIIRFVYS